MVAATRRRRRGGAADLVCSLPLSLAPTTLLLLAITTMPSAVRCFATGGGGGGGGGAVSFFVRTAPSSSSNRPCFYRRPGNAAAATSKLSAVRRQEEQKQRNPQERRQQQQQQRRDGDRQQKQGSGSSGRNNGKKTSVAVIGGGIAGLSFARRLAAAPAGGASDGDGSSSQRNYYDVTVFDTGRLRVGGRCSSRLPGDAPKEGGELNKHKHPLSKFKIDHAAQVVAVVPPEGGGGDGDGGGGKFEDFRGQVRDWLDRGTLAPFPPQSLFRIAVQDDDDGGPSILDLQPSLEATTTLSTYYYAPGGMNTLATSMASDAGGAFEVRNDVWVSPSNGARYVHKAGKWGLKASGRNLGLYDVVVVAHNGKCADRLLSKSPAKDLHRLLRVNFAPTVSPKAARMTLNSIYSLTFALSPKSMGILSNNSKLPPTFMCGFVSGHPDLSFLTCQSNKLNSAGGSAEDLEVWTVFSSGRFAKRHKAAQEFLSDETIDEVSGLLWSSLEGLLNLPPESIKSRVVDRRLQLWGAAVPLNTWKSSNNNSEAEEGFVYDAQYGVGVCGDWLVEPSIAGAWTSGRRLAEHLLRHRRGEEVGGDVATATVGLEGSFVRSESAREAGIGAVRTAPPTSSSGTASSLLKTQVRG